MFGYVGIDLKSLSKEERTRYNEIYCGLCHEIGAEFGGACRTILTYDMTFLAILLSSLYEMEETAGFERCAIRPFLKHPFVTTKAASYAANMNIVLGYYQSLDDVHDDHSIAAEKRSGLLKKFIPRIKERYPRQCGAIEELLEQLSKIEASGEMNPDIPANCFGELMGELFIIQEDEFSSTLRSMGEALGRFIYLLDAHNDLKADIKRKRYNPLVAQMDMDFKPVLMMVMGECTTEFEKLALKRDLHILRNILYSGVWMNYKITSRGAEN